MDDNKWIDRLLVLASDKKELDIAFSGSDIINFVYRIFDDMFDFQKNNEIINIYKSKNSFEMIIMNRRFIVVYEIGNQFIDFYFNHDLGSGEDSVIFGKLAVTSKVFRFTKDTDKVKFNRLLLERIATDLFKPLTESELSPTFSFK